MGTIGDLLTGLGTFLKGLASWCLDGILLLLKTILFILFDGVLTVVTTFFSGLNLANSLGRYVCDWSGLPSQVGYVIGQTGIPACIALLLGAVAVRMLINLIPSWATRV